MYRNILLATDGSPIAERAVRQGLELALSLGARVTAVTVTDMFPTNSTILMPRPSDVALYEDRAALAASGILGQVSAAASALGVECTTRHVVDELPADGILKACRENGCDLIVMATHGRRGLDRLLLGSQASRVVTASTVPVLICR